MISGELEAAIVSTKKKVNVLLRGDLRQLAQKIKKTSQVYLKRISTFLFENNHLSSKRLLRVENTAAEVPRFNLILRQANRSVSRLNRLANYELTPASLSQGLVPIYVNATAGTTVYGAFDPLNDIADICHKHSLWMHVDVRYIILSLLV